MNMDNQIIEKVPILKTKQARSASIYSSESTDDDSSKNSNFFNLNYNYRETRSIWQTNSERRKES